MGEKLLAQRLIRLLRDTRDGPAGPRWRCSTGRRTRGLAVARDRVRGRGRRAGRRRRSPGSGCPALADAIDTDEAEPPLFACVDAASACSASTRSSARCCASCGAGPAAAAGAVPQPPVRLRRGHGALWSAGWPAPMQAMRRGACGARGRSRSACCSPARRSCRPWPGSRHRLAVRARARRRPHRAGRS